MPSAHKPPITDFIVLNCLVQFAFRSGLIFPPKQPAFAERRPGLAHATPPRARSIFCRNTYIRVSLFLSRTSALFAHNEHPQPLSHGRGRVLLPRISPAIIQGTHPCALHPPTWSGRARTLPLPPVTNHQSPQFCGASRLPSPALVEGRRSAFLFQDSLLLLEWPRFYIRVPGAGPCPTPP